MSAVDGLTVLMMADQGGLQMAMYEVYIIGSYGKAIGMFLTGSQSIAQLKVRDYEQLGFKAWYEQIQ